MKHAAAAVALKSLFVLAMVVPVVQAAPMNELGAYKDKNSLGKWACDAKELGSNKTFKANVEKTAEFDGNTYVERYAEVASNDHPNAWKAVFIMSYDPKAQKWVRNGVDNAGERNAASSSGWNGDTWVWENDGANIVLKAQGANAYSFAVDVKKDSSVKRVVEAQCKRV